MSKNDIFLTGAPESKETYLRIISETAAAIAESFSGTTAYSGPEPRELKKAVDCGDILPPHGLGFSAVLERAKTQVLPNFVRTSSTGYMAHLHSPAVLESIAAELIIATFNQSMDSWDQSPVATEIEVAVVRRLCRMYGYDPDRSDGVFTSGGSQSNITGILLARDLFCAEKFGYDVKKYGLPENYRKFRLYTSCISHFSMEKSVHLLGLGYDAVVKVPVDRAQKMDTAALRRLIARDKAAGNIPFCVVATIGTTDFGSIDPVTEIAEICRTEGIKLHADAAYGSGAILSPTYAERISGLDRCDSITVDFHKMFLLPISCSAILVKDKHSFEPLELHADYLNREEDEEDGYTNLVGKSLQTTRRFDALKVWIAFQTRGKDGWAALIDSCIENAAYLYRRLCARAEFSAVTSPELSSVVFRLLPLPGMDSAAADEMNKRVRRALLHREGTVIGQTVCDGTVHLKFTLLNPLLTHERLDELLDLIVSLR